MSQIGRQLVKFFQGELLKKTGEAARFQKGNVVPFTRVTEIQPNVRPAAAPAREVMRTSPGQLEIPFGDVRTVRPTTMPARNVPMGRPAPKPEFTVTRQSLSPEEAALLESDPGTFRSIQDLASRASQNLGVEIKPGFFLQPNWSDKLRALETQSLVRSGRSDMTPPGVTGGLAGKPGALVPSPGGRAVDASILEAAIRDVTPGARNLGGSREAMEAISEGARGTAEMPIDVSFRNATGGVQQLDLGSLLRGAGLGAGVMAGSAALVNAFRPEVEQAQTPMGQPTATPETGPLTPAVTGIVESSFPTMGAGQQLPSPGVMGTSAADTRRSELIQAIQQAKATSKMPFMPGSPSAENYPDIAAYYAQRERYASQPDVAAALAGELAKQSPRYAERDIQTWAGSNPELTYELVERIRGNRAMPSQQMPQARGVEISTSMGTNFTNNALGSASAAVGAAFGSQGASDIGATVMPQLVPSLQPLPPDYSKALSRARIPMGY